MAETEYHVASFVVRTRPENAALLIEQVQAIAGLEVHAEQDGKLVVTAEAADRHALADVTAQIEQIKSVITVSPVYHEYSSFDDPDGQVPAGHNNEEAR